MHVAQQKIKIVNISLFVVRQILRNLQNGTLTLAMYIDL